MARAESSPRPLPAVSGLRPTLFYGWFVVAGAFAVSFVTVGIGFYGQTIFLDALIREHGWTKSQVSSASTLYFITSGMVGLLVGRVVDRWGSRGSLVAGALTMAAALLWLGAVRTLPELFAAYALLAASFSMSAAIPLSAIVNRWFVRERARALSISQTGVSTGGLVLVPLVTTMIASEGLSAATSWLAILVIVVVIPATVWVLRGDPHEYGLRADGGHEPDSRGPIGGDFARWRVRDALRTTSFLALAVSFAAILLCQTGLAVHHLHLLRGHLDTSAAALGGATLPLGSIIGRLLSGRVADRSEKRLVAAVFFSMQGAALVALSFASHPTTLLAASLLFGFTIGAVFMLQSLLVADLFGLASFGTLFGVLNLISSFGGGLGPLTVGMLAEKLGGYPAAIRVLGGIAFFAAFIVSRLQPPPALGRSTA